MWQTKGKCVEQKENVSNDISHASVRVTVKLNAAPSSCKDGHPIMSLRVSNLQALDLAPLPRPLPVAAPFFGFATLTSDSDSLAVVDWSRPAVAAPRAEGAALEAFEGGGVPDSLAVEVPTFSSPEDWLKID